jgi:hypothetical protein
MFLQYDYFLGLMDDFPEIKQISRVTGLSGMEEVLENIRSLKLPALIIEDDGEGYLDLTQGNFDNSYHNFTIVDKVKLSDSSERVKILNQCFSIGLKIMKRMMIDSRDFGDPCYGFDHSKINYLRIGPMVNNTYGYTFSYTMRNENFKLTS